MAGCLGCEIRRAKVYALAALTVGKPLADAAIVLSRRYGANYYVKDGALWRDAHPKAVRVYGKDSVQRTE